MLKVKQSYPEIDDIKQDVSALSADAANLARHMKEDGKKKVDELSSKASDTYEDLKVQGRKEFAKVEDHVRAKPAQSIAIAFAAGMVASFLLKRR